jgi:hypothetical protein
MTIVVGESAEANKNIVLGNFFRNHSIENPPKRTMDENANWIISAALSMAESSREYLEKYWRTISL